MTNLCPNWPSTGGTYLDKPYFAKSEFAVQKRAKPFFAKPECDKTEKRNLLNHTVPHRNLLIQKSGKC